MQAMDPHTVLGLDPGATPEEAAARYRRLAKQWHPDVAGEEGARRMAEINAAYDLLRSGVWQDRHRPAPSRTAPAPRPRAGAWLDPATRRALGPELLAALRRDEAVALVTPVSVWASPSALLAVT